MRKRQICRKNSQMQADETAGSDNVSGEVEALQKKYNELNDSHLALDGGVWQLP